VISSGTPSVQGETNINTTLTGTIEISGLSIDGSAVVSGAYKEKLATDLTSKALGLYYIHSSGFGVGYASNTMKYEVEMIATKDIPATVTADVSIPGITSSANVTFASAGQTFGLQKITIKSQFLDLLYNLDDLVFEGTILAFGIGIPVGASSDIDVSISSNIDESFRSLVEAEIQNLLNNLEPQNVQSGAIFFQAGYALNEFEILLAHRINFYKATYAIGFGIGKTDRSIQVQETSIGLGYRF